VLLNINRPFRMSMHTSYLVNVLLCQAHCSYHDVVVVRVPVASGLNTPSILHHHYNVGLYRFDRSGFANLL
jgi:hypothetical protein